MNITPFIFLIIYLAGVGLFLLLAIFNIYHIMRFGFSKIGGMVVTFIFLLAAAGIILGTFQLLQKVAWREPININLPFIGNNSGF